MSDYDVHIDEFGNLWGWSVWERPTYGRRISGDRMNRSAAHLVRSDRDITLCGHSVQNGIFEGPERTDKRCKRCLQALERSERAKRHNKQMSEGCSMLRERVSNDIKRERIAQRIEEAKREERRIAADLANLSAEAQERAIYRANLDRLIKHASERAQREHSRWIVCSIDAHTADGFDARQYFLESSDPEGLQTDPEFSAFNGCIHAVCDADGGIEFCAGVRKALDAVQIFPADLEFGSVGGGS